MEPAARARKPARRCCSVRSRAPRAPPRPLTLVGVHAGGDAALALVVGARALLGREAQVAGARHALGAAHRRRQRRQHRHGSAGCPAARQARQRLPSGLLPWGRGGGGVRRAACPARWCGGEGAQDDGAMALGPGRARPVGGGAGRVGQGRERPAEPGPTAPLAAGVSWRPARRGGGSVPGACRPTTPPSGASLAPGQARAPAGTSSEGPRLEQAAQPALVAAQAARTRGQQRPAAAAAQPTQASLGLGRRQRGRRGRRRGDARRGEAAASSWGGRVPPRAQCPASLPSQPSGRASSGSVSRGAPGGAA